MLDNDVHLFSSRSKRVPTIEETNHFVYGDRRNHGNTSDKNKSFNVEHLISDGNFISRVCNEEGYK